MSHAMDFQYDRRVQDALRFVVRGINGVRSFTTHFRDLLSPLSPLLLFSGHREQANLALWP